MNFKKIILAVALSLGMAGLSNAGTVYMTGSTAFRNSVYNTLNAAGAVFDSAPSFAGYDGSSAGGCNYMTFVGTIGGVAMTVKCHWSGSEAGVKDVVTGQTETFLDDSLNGTGYNAGVPGATINASADLAMADNAQRFSRTPTPELATGSSVGIIPFTWVRNPSSLWTGANNVTDQQIRQAMKGFCHLALFTGNNADTTYVYVSGRNNGSGTRVNAFGTSGFGIFTSPNQIELDASGNMQFLASVGDYAGDDGFESGGTLAGTLGVDTATKSDLFNGGTGFTVLSYLGRGDANKAISLGAVELTLNGVASTTANIVEGKYNYWGVEYIYQKNGASVDAQSVYGKLANTSTGINANLDGTTGIKLTDMHATRTGPTADPVHN